jgi:hypothetical protein
MPPPTVWTPSTRQSALGTCRVAYLQLPSWHVAQIGLKLAALLMQIR